MQSISNWGNYPKVEGIIYEFSRNSEAADIIAGKPCITIRGSGLSYGDASLSKEILSTTKHNQILNFNEIDGIITVEAGVTLDKVIKYVLPKGWFLYVTPGTKFITVGGAVGGDVHGKNHHKEGSFCDYVVEMSVMMANGNIKKCTSESEVSLFRAICGGVGLGALILTVTFKLKKITSAYIDQQNIVINNLDEMLDKLQEFHSATYSVSWIDCIARGKNLGRGILMLGEHKDIQSSENSRLKIHSDPNISLPINMPGFLLNKFTVGAFNSLYFSKNSHNQLRFKNHYNSFFYPLDFAKSWNRLYGHKGFVQYQFVLPFSTSKKGLRKILEIISEAGTASFLAVLKTLGAGNNLLSFPMPGFTLALDFPVSSKVLQLCETLDHHVVDNGGRIYLVKDARMNEEVYWKGYPNAHAFKEIINQIDPNHKFSSRLATRLNMI